MPLFQTQAKCKAIDMKIILYSHANKTHFHKKGFALSLVLKVRVLKLGNGLSLVFCRLSALLAVNERKVR